MLIFSADIPKIEGKGEDATPIAESFGEGIGAVAVFDGLGGSGATKYELDGQQFTGAWFASRLVRSAAASWFRLLSDSEKNDPKKEISAFADLLQQFLRHAASKLDHNPSKLKSNLIRRLPTTISAIYFRKSSDGFDAWSINAGDSRSYLLTPKHGLQVLTEDDIVGEKKDALQSLYGDGRMANCLDADNDFQMSVRKFEVQEGVFVSASDGCFDYVKFPAHFEYFLLDTMMRSDSLEQWNKEFVKEFKTFAGDDVTLGLMAPEYSDIGEMKEAFSDRHKLLAEKYVDPIDGLERKVIDTEGQDEEVLKEREELRNTLWASYRLDYELLMKEKEKTAEDA